MSLSVSEARERLKTLQAQKDALEQRIEVAGLELDGALSELSEGSAKSASGDKNGDADEGNQRTVEDKGVKFTRTQGGLVDAEGFPTVDYGTAVRVRTGRRDFATLQTDHVAVMKAIEAALAEFHAAVQREREAQGTHTTPELELRSDSETHDSPVDTPKDMPVSSGKEVPETPPPPPLPPSFARVNSVEVGSPAQTAGLRVGDEICEFGSVRGGTLGGTLQSVGQLVPSMENREVRLVIGRPAETEVGLRRVELRLRPMRWAGRGLIGCHLVPA